MEVTIKKLSRKQKKRELAIEHIASSGYTEQNEKLMALGFSKPWKNLKILERFNGDFDTSLQKLQENKKKLEEEKHLKECEKHGEEATAKHHVEHHHGKKEWIQKRVEELGFTEANAKLL